jgi:hypothetical protein
MDHCHNLPKRQYWQKGAHRSRGKKPPIYEKWKTISSSTSQCSSSVANSSIILKVGHYLQMQDFYQVNFNFFSCVNVMLLSTYKGNTV